MDVNNAVLAVAAIVGLTALVKGLIPQLSGPLNGRLVQLASIVLAVGVLFLARETVWAHEQVLNGKALDQLDSASVAFAGLLVGLGANVLDRTLKSVSNIGQNTDRYSETPPG